MMLNNESDFLHAETYLDTQRRAYYNNKTEEA